MAAELLTLYARRELAQGHAFAPDNAWQMEAEAAFPFVETPEQMEAINAVKADMERPRPMDRLICGDVGYGKTEVAVRAAFKAVGDGKQVAVLVPTTVLAEQHGQTFRERLAGFPVRIDVLSRFRHEAEQRQIVKDIKEGSVDIAVGTHRLLQRDVEFKELGLVVIDEEQRFGVSHKERLRQMSEGVDTLTLSATPIPRTLQMALSGIRDMSTIMTPPEERLAIQTYVLGWDDDVLRDAIDRELQRGGQVYFVHNRVHNIERIVARLQRIVPDAAITVGHGQMHEDQLERVMMEFAAGDHDILVCTTIIESGLDIPNVNTIFINNADQFGLSQLYQLRGRVGRGAHQAYAYLLYDRDRTMTEQGQKRLEAIFEATELGAGFQIALRDLEIRGAGNVLGSEQSGQIAAIGFEMYSRLVADAVAALRAALPGGQAAPATLPPVPNVDLPISAHIPDTYVEDIHDRLNVYQRVATIEDAAGVAVMQEELRDRFGPVPQAVESLLYLSLVKSVARRARVESIKTDEQMFHIRVRGGVSEAVRARVTSMRLDGVLVGPNQVRIDRVGHAQDWQPLLIRILRAMMEAGQPSAPARP
jgi:transcription-repair coupling factor (superfamily II helicase)